MSTPVLIAIIAGGVLLLVLLVALLLKGGKSKQPARACLQCKRNMLPTWSKCMFCGWTPGARLEFILGPLAGQNVRLTEDMTTLGSVAGNTIVLADPAVSKRHVAIRRAEGEFEIADLGSTNGIYVNGHKVPKKSLQPGDIVRVGNTELVFRRE
ncbi:MAG: FHA domain-containing protein [Kofleriaceae bacterium]|nr:FHA domain-containing protein [Myxococcales bacterium]MCB9561035.1 FHA domain-containing protein [Kofleriaceae bacterium]